MSGYGVQESSALVKEIDEMKPDSERRATPYIYPGEPVVNRRTAFYLSLQRPRMPLTMVGIIDAAASQTPQHGLAGRDALT